MKFGMWLIVCTALLLWVGVVDAKWESEGLVLGTESDIRDLRCVRFKGGKADVHNDTAYPIYSYEFPFLIRDERSHRDYWLYGEGCVKYDPSKRNDVASMRMGPTWTVLTVGLNRAPGYRPWAFGVDYPNSRGAAAEDHFVIAQANGYRVRLPDETAPYHSAPAPTVIPVGVAEGSALFDLFRDANYDIATGQRDDRLPGQAVTRIWANTPASPDKPKYVIGWFAGLGVMTEGMNLDDPAFAFLRTLALRDNSFGWDLTRKEPIGGAGAAYLFPNVALTHLVNVPCENGRVVVEGLIRNESISQGHLAVEYSWDDGQTWRNYTDYQLASYENTRWGRDRAPIRIVLDAPDPWSASTLHVRIVPQGSLRGAESWHQQDNQQQVRVQACRCDLTVTRPTLDSPPIQDGFFITTFVSRRGCASLESASVTVSVNGQVYGAPARFSRDQARSDVRIFIGPQPCGAQVTLRAVVDEANHVVEFDENNNYSAWLTVEVEPCASAPPPVISCDPSLPPELCGGSDQYERP